MTRMTRPGSIQSVLRAAYRLVGGVEAVAEDLSVRISTVSYGTELRDDRPGGLGLNYADQLARQHSGVAALLARHFAVLGGGSFVTGEAASHAVSRLEHAKRLVIEAAEGSVALMEIEAGGCLQAAIRELMDVEEMARSIRIKLQAEDRAQGGSRPGVP